MPLLWSAAALLTGLVTAFQPGINAALARKLDHPLHASLVNFGTGLLWLALLSLVWLHALPRPSLLAGAAWWHWLGGACGALFVTMSLVVVPKIGVAYFFALIVTGQMISSLVLDRTGWLGLPQREVGPQQFVGAALLVVGVLLIAKR